MNNEQNNIVVAEETSTNIKKPRGFACMSPEKVREIASRGGRSAHEKGVAHRYTSEKARIAGALGGKKTQELRRAAKAAA